MGSACSYLARESFLDRKSLTLPRVTAVGLKAFRSYLDTITTQVRSAPKR